MFGWKAEQEKIDELAEACLAPGANPGQYMELEAACQELFETYAQARPKTRDEAFRIGLSAAPAFVAFERGGWLTRWISEALPGLSSEFLQDLAETYLVWPQSQGWARVREIAEEDFFNLTLRSQHPGLWVAYSRALHQLVRLLFEDRQISLADVTAERFEQVPVDFLAVTRIHRARTELERLRAYAKEQHLPPTKRSLETLSITARDTPDPAYRELYLEGLLTWTPLAIQLGRAEDLGPHEKLASQMVVFSPEDKPACTKAFQFLGMILPTLLQGNLPKEFLPRWTEAVRVHRKNPEVLEDLSRMLVEALELPGDPLAGAGESLEPLIQALEGSSKSLIRDRCQALRIHLGIPRSGCLGVVLWMLVAQGLGPLGLWLGLRAMLAS